MDFLKESFDREAEVPYDKKLEDLREQFEKYPDRAVYRACIHINKIKSRCQSLGLTAFTRAAGAIDCYCVISVHIYTSLKRSFVNVNYITLLFNIKYYFINLIYLKSNQYLL